MVKIKEMLASAAVIVALTGTTAFAMPEAVPRVEDGNVKINQGHKHDHCKKDPIKHLEKKKEEVQKQLKEGKLTQEQADELLKRIDDRIADINKFKALPLEQKKEKILNELKMKLDQLVKDGSMTQEEANNMLEEAKKKLEKWNGTDFPQQ